jgi:MFS family permease
VIPGRHRNQARPRSSFQDLFAVRDFRVLWSAQALSYTGDQIAQVAIAVLVYARTGSPAITAFAYALTYLPPVFAGRMTAALVELVPRRQAMIVLDLVRAGLVTIMALPRAPLALICTLLAATVLLGPPFAAARAALLPEVVPPGSLVRGFTAGNLTFQASQVVGFLAGGALVATLGAHRALALDALSFCLSAAIIAIWVENRLARTAGGRGAAGWGTAARLARSPSWHATRDGVALVFGDAGLRTLVLLGWLAGFAVVPEGLAAPYAHTLHGGAGTVGLLMASMPAGMAAGGLLAGRVTRPDQPARLIGWLAVLSCTPLACSLLHPALWLLLPLWLLAGAAGAYQLVAAEAFVRALRVADRGPALGVAQSGLLAAQGLGILAAGVIALRFGTPAAVGIAGLAGAGTAAGLASRWAVHRRRLAGPGHQAGQAARAAHAPRPAHARPPEPSAQPRPSAQPEPSAQPQPAAQPGPVEQPGQPGR